MLDYIKDTGFHYSTKAAITISISDMEIPEEKESIIQAAEHQVEKYENAYRKGFASREECDEKIIKIWHKTTDDVADALMDSLGTLNNLFIMAHSGARGSKNQIRQIGGMRGLMAKANGETVENSYQGQLQRGSVGTGLLHINKRRQKGSGRYSASNSRLRLSDKKTCRRIPQHHYQRAGLRHR